MLALSPVCSRAASGSNVIPSDSIAKDFRVFCDALESAHPDPYSAFGGRPYFSEARDAMLERIHAENAWDVTKLCDLINEFVVPLGDMHTFAQLPQSSDSSVRYVQRIRLEVVNDGLMVSGISKPLAKLLGSRLLGIGGESMDEIAVRMKRFKPSENSIGNLSNFTVWGNQDGMLDKLGLLHGDSVQYQLLTPQADTIVATLPLKDLKHVNEVEIARISTDMDLPTGNLDYQFLDDKKDIMYFRLSSVMARENYKYCYRHGWPDALDGIGSYYYDLGKEMPEDPEEALAGIPSISERFAEMLKLMKDHSSGCLIIDLRGNRGGWTPITLPTMMLIYGDEYYGKDFGVYNMRLISKLYLNKINATIGDLSQSWGIPLQVGDYLTMRDFIPDTITNLRDRHISGAMCETTTLLRQLDGIPLYRPDNVYVLTDANTNSAAFHYSFYLTQMGAKLVGVPSSQAPNTYMEVTPLTLPCTSIHASVSNTLQKFYPDDHPRAKVLTPDIGITSADYARHGYDANTPVKVAIEHYLTTDFQHHSPR